MIEPLINTGGAMGVRKLKYRDIIKMLESHDWYLERQRGSHLVYRHPNRQGSVTVPGGGKLNRDAKPGTLNSILKQAGIKPS
jgi:predicted RNA binding protein YcfA (HicA-like mRNA interferase family)